jgi:hypothetical protein
LKQFINVRVTRSRGRIIITVFGLPAVILTVIILVFPHLFFTHLSPEDAENRVRQYLRWKTSERYMTLMMERGISIPDIDMANYWKEDIEHINSLKFISVKVKRPFTDILNAVMPDYLVRIIIEDQARHNRIRYFRLSHSGIDREISYFMWFFSI